MTKLRVLIADDYPVVRHGMRAILDAEPDITVIGEAADGDSAVTQTMALNPNVLVTDMNMPGCTGRQLIEQVTRRSPETAILVVTMHKEEHYAISSLRAGARGFVNKSRSPREIVEAVRQVGRGNMYLSAELAQRIALGSFGERDPGALHEQLTSREQEIFLKLAQGRSVTDIADRLHLSPKTVSTHKTRIFQKLRLDNMSSLVRYAIDHHIL